MLKKQTTVSRSSAEAEYRCVANTTIEMSWIESLLHELRVKTKRQPVIWCDNLSAVLLNVNPIQHCRTKHVELDIHFVRERVADKKLVVNHIPATHQLADILAKPISRRNFELFRDKLKVTGHSRSHIPTDSIFEAQSKSSNMDIKEDNPSHKNLKEHHTEKVGSTQICTSNDPISQI